MLNVNTWALKPKVNILPSILTYCTQAVAFSLTTISGSALCHIRRHVEFHNLKAILTGSNLSSRQFSELRGEADEARRISLRVNKGCALVGLTCLAVGKLSKLHRTVSLSKRQKTPTVLNSIHCSCISHSSILISEQLTFMVNV